MSGGGQHNHKGEGSFLGGWTILLRAIHTWFIKTCRTAQ